MSKKHRTSVSQDLQKALDLAQAQVLFNQSLQSPLLCIVGATASGKSALAIQLAQKYNAEIISVDASQVYRWLDIGTGKITTAQQSLIPHHLIDCANPDEKFDAGLFCQKADACIADIWQRGKRVILCGGTGLYFKALFYGLCATPEIDEGVKTQIQNRINQGELSKLYDELLEVDPILAQKLDPQDKQRIERALCVYLSTQKPLSAWQAEHGFQVQRYAGLCLGIHWDREVLNQRIALRIQEMFDQGFIEEVRSLMDQGYHQALQSLSAIGYRLVADALAHENPTLALKEAQEKMLFATRQYARRQERFFEYQLPTYWLDAPVDSTISESIVDRIWPN